MSTTKENMIIDGTIVGTAVLTKEVRGYKVLSCKNIYVPKVLKEIICPVTLPTGAILVRPLESALSISHKIRTNMYDIECQELMKLFKKCYG